MLTIDDIHAIPLFSTLWVSELERLARVAGSAVFLVLEMDAPFDGLLRVSADPLRYAYAHVNQ